MSMNVKSMAYAALFAALTAVGAWMTIPLPWVPITLQLMVMLIAGMLLGSRVGALSQVVYVLMGIVGLPVFSARQAGIGVLLGPTGGYIIGMVAAAWVVGRFLELTAGRGQATLPSGLRYGIAVVLGIVMTYVPGTLVLTWHVGSFQTALKVGVIPFIAGDLLKGFVAYVIARGLALRGIVLNLDVSEGGTA